MNLNENLQLAASLLPIETWNTLYMVFASAAVALIAGIPLGILLTVTSRGHIGENRQINRFVGAIVNVGRSFPFAILMVAVIPFTRLIAGTSLGTTASIVPLSLAAIPFAARFVEVALSEVSKELVEAAIVMGSTRWQVIQKILLPEALPALLAGITTMIIHLIGYSAMAGTMGGGGLGKIAIQYGYQRFNPFLMIVTVLLLIFIVQAVQWGGNSIVRKINSQRGRGYSQ